MITTSSTPVKIPVIDFKPFVIGDVGKQQQVAQELYNACHELGFVYIKNHGVSQALIEQVFLQSKRFFDLSLEVKHQLAWSSEFSNRGYIGIERERLDPEQPGDLKEAFNVGKEGLEATSPRPDNPALTQNQWPADEDFRRTVLNFFEACTEAANRAFYAFELALQLPEAFIINKHAKQEHVLRLLHYPPMSREPELGQIRAGAHSDYGSLTLLFQDEMGGLEVKTAGGEWIAAPVIPNTVLVNTGDLTQRWSNDVFRSTKHRVGMPVGDRSHKSRYSVAFFCQPDHDAEITCIESCQGPDKPPLYPPILAGEYLLSLLQATY